MNEEQIEENGLEQQNELPALEVKYKKWKDALFDTSKRNKLINYRKTKRTTLEITEPNLPTLYQRIVLNGETITFIRKKSTASDQRVDAMVNLLKRLGAPLELIEGEINGTMPPDDLNRTLKQLRNKARQSQEERGINILYLCFGFLTWHRKDGDNDPLYSPLILVPVNIELRSAASSFMLTKLDEEVLINPTLEYVLRNERGIKLPDFNSAEDVTLYLDAVRNVVKPLGWNVTKEVNLGLLSFLKMVMYRDLDEHRDAIFSNSVIRAFGGDGSGLIQIRPEWKNFDHDSIPYSDCTQVVEADASQQDAIFLSRQGVSFVLQGPPGTGKSQTITNIIAQALADGKKVLFVSEKMAALSVVYHRLSEVGLADYCLALHDYKIEKKKVLQDLVNTLDAPTKNVKRGAEDFLPQLEKERRECNAYVEEMNKVREPLGKSIYEVVTDLSILEDYSTCTLKEDPSGVTGQQLLSRLNELNNLQKFLVKYDGDIRENPWRNTTIQLLGYETGQEVRKSIDDLKKIVFRRSKLADLVNNVCHTERTWSWADISRLILTLRQYLSFYALSKKLDDKYKPQVNPETAVSLYHELNRLIKEAQSLSLLIVEYDTEKNREEEKAKLETCRQMIQILTDFNKTFNEHLPMTQEGYVVMCGQIRSALSVETVAPEFFENGKIENAEQLASSIRSSLDELASLAGDRTIRPEKDAAVADDVEKVSNTLRESDADNEIPISSLSEKLTAVQKRQGLLHNAQGLIQAVNETYGLDIPLTKKGLTQVNDLFHVLTLDVPYKTSWFMNRRIDSVLQEVNELLGIVTRRRSLRLDLDSEWSSGFYNLPASDLLGRFRTDYKSALRFLKPSYRNDKRTLAALRKNGDGKLEDITCEESLTKLQEYNELGRKLEERKTQSEQLFGNLYDGEKTNFLLLRSILEASRIAEIYIDRYGLTPSLKNFMDQDRHIRRDGMIQERKILSWVESGDIAETLSILESDNAVLEQEEEKEQSKAESCKQLIDAAEKTKHLADMHLTIEALPEEPTIGDLRRELSSLESYEMNLKEYRDKVNSFIQMFPGASVDEESDWHSVERDLEQLQALMNDMDSAHLKNWLMQDLSARYETTLAGCNMSEILSMENNRQPFQNTTEVDSRIDLLDRVSDWSERADADNSSISAKSILLHDYTQSKKQIENQKEAAVKTFENLNVKEDADTIDKLAQLFEEYCNLPDITDSAGACYSDPSQTDEQISKLNNICLGEPKLTEEEAAFDNFDKWFTNENFADISIREFYQRLIGCENLEALNSWISFAFIVDACVKEGTGEYIDYLKTNAEVSPKAIVPCYKKSFLVHWLMDVMEKEHLSGLQTFQSYLHEATIRDFAKHDRQSMSLSQAVLQEKLSKLKPTGELHLYNAEDEISILRKESNKKRRIMPLRKLFRAIPTLLQKLKPCFMMSPLTVSYFLDSEAYHFDLVIFDEASQILPEDAVGAIYRGNQVVIAGDTKQMPPTNFFMANSNDPEDYDDDDEESEDDLTGDMGEVGESVLEEANKCLPLCTLIWHYRSRDESLIAFSNRAFYDNKLITFPNCNRMKDRGLEYIYVPNGVYKARSNEAEAKRCVELVEEAIHNHPERSLGIIAFSEKQQSVIEDAIDKFREEHPEYDDFFREDKHEPFFVKNLENVQGDERDTIIFSICYAKNEKGRMYYRFGPLGLAGGERRLNVAITRAKYNVKLVGSIMPMDLDLSHIKAEGVKCLREYIEYAMQKDSQIPMELNMEETNDTFADLVANFIYAHGYRYSRNVGESDYRVDIGVAGDDLSKGFFAGVECDGSNYCIARTARDRDVLRSSVMKAAGWNLFHVWSFNWYKNPRQEKQRLLEFLEKASQDTGNKQNVNESGLKKNITNQPVAEEILEEVDAPEQKNFSFDVYHYCSDSDMYSVEGDYDSILTNRIRKVLETEAPIYSESLYRYMAPTFGNERVTAAVRISVENDINNNLTKEVERRGDFYYLRGQEIHARVPADGDAVRPLDQICPEEIQDAMVMILKNAYGLQKQSLIQETSRVFGFGRVGSKASQILEDNLQTLCNEGVIRNINGYLSMEETN